MGSVRCATLALKIIGRSSRHPAVTIPVPVFTESNLRSVAVHVLHELLVMSAAASGRLTNDEARTLAQNNSATSLLVAALIMAGIVWAMRHPRRGIPDLRNRYKRQLLLRKATQECRCCLAAPDSIWSAN